MVDSPDAIEDDPLYEEVFQCRGDRVIFETMNHYVQDYDHTIRCLYCIQALAAHGGQLRVCIATEDNTSVILGLLRRFRDSEEITQYGLSSLGYFVREYGNVEGTEVLKFLISMTRNWEMHCASQGRNSRDFGRDGTISG